MSTTPCPHDRVEPGRGYAFVGHYFQVLPRGYEMHAFLPVAFLPGATEVAGRLHVDFSIRPTGNRIATEVIHHWTVGEDGCVARFRDFEDTLGWIHAWRPQPTSSHSLGTRP